MTSKKLGLYVHIPFCLKKCNYCDFCSFSNVTDDEKEAYVNFLIKEITGYSHNPKLILNSVFFGGGTPTILKNKEIGRIVDAIKSTFDFDKNIEVTIESNPGTVTEEKLAFYKEIGFNRISIGLQTIHENELKLLGRIHSFEDFKVSFSLARKVGFSNINVDLMYAIPNQTVDSFKSTLEAISALSPEHISAYSLILEEETPFFDMRESLNFPCEDEERKMYDIVRFFLKEHGYNHYEISNYAKRGFESKHNLIYWNLDEYIGVGLNASSYFEGKRYKNSASFEDYFQNVMADSEVETLDDESFEFVMLRLRLKSGFSLSEYENRFGKSFYEGREATIEKFVALGLLKLEDNMCFLTEEGMYVSNSILIELLY